MNRVIAVILHHTSPSGAPERHDLCRFSGGL